MRRCLKCLPVGLALFALAGCHLDMVVQPKVKTQGENDFFSDRMGSRAPVVGTVPYGSVKLGVFETGRNANGSLTHVVPVQIDEALVARGQERFEAFCTPCHGGLGDGKGMIAQRGFELKRPVGNYHTDRLRRMPIGHFFDVITNGYGTMYPQGSRIKPHDRWAIAVYVRALQLSQHAAIGDIDPATASALGAQSTPRGSGPLFDTRPVQTVTPVAQTPAPTEGGH